MTFAQQIQNIDYQSLNISEYSRRYILRMLPNIDYYLDIYSRCLDHMIRQSKKAPSDITMVDYGGGHGFLSCYAKHRGIGKVIYIDFNSLATKTVQAVAQQLGLGPDMVLHGDAETLKEWCLENNVRPDFIMGMDVIEHVYRLDTFFADLFAIRPDMQMLFTTGSTPYNPYVKRKLRKVMLSDELGENGFLHERRHHIAHSFRQFTPEQLDYWAKNTRGLNYDDTLEAVANNRPHILADPYNTCDPATGSWTERILTLRQYQDLIAPHQAKVSVRLGFYNSHRSGAKGFASRILNLLITMLHAKVLAPFIVLVIKK